MSVTDTIHARFSVGPITRVPSYGSVDGPKEFTKVHMYAVQGKPFGEATPYGSIEMTIADEAAQALIRSCELGEHFDVVFFRHNKPTVESVSERITTIAEGIVTPTVGS